MDWVTENETVTEEQARDILRRAAGLSDDAISRALEADQSCYLLHAQPAPTIASNGAIDGFGETINGRQFRLRNGRREFIRSEMENLGADIAMFAALRARTTIPAPKPLNPTHEKMREAYIALGRLDPKTYPTPTFENLRIAVCKKAGVDPERRGWGEDNMRRALRDLLPK